MSKEQISDEQLEAAFADMGETGSWKISNGGLYVRREENADWRYYGHCSEERAQAEADSLAEAVPATYPSCGNSYGPSRDCR